MSEIITGQAGTLLVGHLAVMHLGVVGTVITERLRVQAPAALSGQAPKTLNYSVGVQSPNPCSRKGD